MIRLILYILLKDLRKTFFAVFVIALIFVAGCIVVSLLPEDAEAKSKAENIGERHYDTVVFLGDSNIWIGGEDCSGKRSWAYWVTQGLNPDVVKSYARSGATIGNTRLTAIDPDHYSELLNDTNTLYNQVVRLRRDINNGAIGVPDLVIIGAGVNDAWFADRRPGSLKIQPGQMRLSFNCPPSDATTVQMAMSVILSGLADYVQPDHIVIVTPPLTTKTSPERIDSVTRCIRSVADKESRIVEGRNCIDEECLKREYKKFQLTTDGVHTSEAGAQKLGQYILNQFDNPITL